MAGVGRVPERLPRSAIGVGDSTYLRDPVWESGSGDTLTEELRLEESSAEGQEVIDVVASRALKTHNVRVTFNHPVLVAVGSTAEP